MAASGLLNNSAADLCLELGTGCWRAHGHNRWEDPDRAAFSRIQSLADWLAHLAADDADDQRSSSSSDCSSGI